MMATTTIMLMMMTTMAMPIMMTMTMMTTMMLMTMTMMTMMTMMTTTMMLMISSGLARSRQMSSSLVRSLSVCLSVCLHFLHSLAEILASFEGEHITCLCLLEQQNETTLAANLLRRLLCTQHCLNHNHEIVTDRGQTSDHRLNPVCDFDTPAEIGRSLLQLGPHQFELRAINNGTSCNLDGALT